MGLHPSTVKTICGLLIFFNALMMKPIPRNVNLANSEKRHNGLTDVTAKEVLIRFWANELWETPT